LTGNAGAGKTTLALKLKKYNTIILDGDDIREINEDWNLSEQGRKDNNLRIARLAKLLSNQGFDVIVAVICPTEEIRKLVKKITGCIFIYLPYKGDDSIPDKPYERPADADVTLSERKLDKNYGKNRTGDY